LNIARIRFLSAQDGTGNVKTAAPQHNESALNLHAVSTWFLPSLGTGYADVLAISHGESKRKSKINFYETCAETVQNYTHV
jgi:hypothetical protein